MKTMTLRGLDPELASKLKETADRDGKSVNQTALDALRTALGLGKVNRHTVVYDDLDHLFGLWDQAEFDRIQGRIDSARTVDEELWQ
jgi:plasmid stability protein